MNLRTHSQRKMGPTRRRMLGVGLVEVMIAMLILAIGFLALAQLQTAATRSAAESRARTAGVNLANDKLEELRAFLGRATDSNGDGDPDLIVDLDGDGIGDDDALAFDGITSGNDAPDEVGTGTRGFDFTREWVSTPCTIDREGAVECGDTVELDQADFLRVSVRVAWESADGSDTAPEAEVIVEDLVSSSTPLDAAVALSQPVTNRERPKVYIQPSRIQSTIPIAIGDSLDSAASDPQPTIIRDNIVRTQFEVLTFSTDDTGLLAERIFDYTVVGCECALDGEVPGNKAYEPTVWNGLTFTRPREVENGVEHPSPNVTGAVDRVTATAVVRNSDPPIIKELCTACCRDHHDTAITSTPKLDPNRPAGEYLLNGNHKHYQPVLSSGEYSFVEAVNPGDEYYETCRFLRRDGFYRLTLDAHLVDLAAFRQNDLDEESETGDAGGYAQYARQFIDSYVNRAAAIGSDYPDFDAATLAAIYSDAKASLSSGFLADLEPTMNYPLTDPGEQLLSRGIYVDYMTPEVLAAIRCKINNTPDLPACLPYRNSEKLELVPFFAVGMTRLNNWAPEDDSVLTLDLTDRNDAFSRGFAVPRRDGATHALAISPISNIGLTNPVPASAIEIGANLRDEVPFEVGLVAPPSDPPRRVLFEISRDRDTLLDDSGVVLLSGTNGTCTRLGQQAGRTSWSCNVGSTGIGSVVFSNYTGTECVRRQGGTCVETAAVRNQLCFAPAPPTLSSIAASNAYSDTTTAGFDGTQGTTPTYAVDVILGTETCPTTDAAPGVSATSPANGEVDVSDTATIEISFNERVVTTASAVTLTCDGGANLVSGLTAQTDVTSLTIPYAGTLPVGATCTLTVIATQVTDSDTIDPPNTMASNHVVTFRVKPADAGDDPPSVTNTTPGNGTTSVLDTQALSVSFSESVVVTNGVSLNCGAGELITGGGTGAAVTTLTPTYSGTLPAGATCTMTVYASRVTDFDLIDPPDNMLADYVATFTVANTNDSSLKVSSALSSNSNSGRYKAGDTLTVNFTEPVNVPVLVSNVSFVCSGAPSTNRASAVAMNVAQNVMTITTSNGGNVNSETCTLRLTAAGFTDTDTIDPPDTLDGNGDGTPGDDYSRTFSGTNSN